MFEICGSSLYKVPHGKLLRASAKFRDGKISSFSLSGDFFLYPEESVELLEDALVGAGVDRKEIAAAIERVVSREKLVLVGFSPEDIATLAELAFKDAKGCS